MERLAMAMTVTVRESFFFFMASGRSDFRVSGKVSRTGEWAQWRIVDIRYLARGVGPDRVRRV